MTRSASLELNDQAVAVASAGSLRSIIGEDHIIRRSEHSWTCLKPTLRRIIEALSAHAVLEIGGGRHPFFSVEEARELGFKLTVNDLDARELQHAPGEFDRLVLDITADIGALAPRPGPFDLIFSRMVFEHVTDARKAWSNVHQLLAPGGVGFAFVPTLFSPPFVINRLIPEALTSRALRMIDSTRNPDAIPKFPAFYASCRASEDALAPMLKAVGFSEICVVPFYGTPYFPAIPVLRHVAKAFDRLIEQRDWRTFASYAYITARK